MHGLVSRLMFFITRLEPVPGLGIALFTAARGIEPEETKNRIC